MCIRDSTNTTKPLLPVGSTHHWNSTGADFMSAPQKLFTYNFSYRLGGYFQNGNRTNFTADLGYRFQPYVNPAVSYTHLWLLRNGISFMPESREKHTETKVIPIRRTIPATSQKQNTSKEENGSQNKNSTLSKQQKIDLILDKIRAKGIHSLTKEEKELLDNSAD